MNIVIYPQEQQASGGFDGGKITEQKPIGFPGEGSAVKRIGPLFYWAWAHAKVEGFIPMHPHQGFEIITYMVNGQAEHADTLGTQSRVAAGGAQVMQTGSGVSHSERFIGPDSEGFQIWFEPHLRDALQRRPTYNQYEHGQFAFSREDGATVKTVIGEGAPVELTADVRMWDIELSAGKTYRHRLAAGRALAGLAIRGDGGWSLGKAGQSSLVSFAHKDFSVLGADAGETEEALLTTDIGLRMILIEAPVQVDYPLYPKR
ncbi:pirin family protein [Paenibacillus doosanensis]|uniref:pirin family protein n=1 Tax=Paenibacillus doosanensis TaxID=1229154 RepID=UPI00217FD180|nr:pirin family protein [Paenibacillus doosanensis]MCS7460265.1 pirin family protein [Paenibacillus doosanensis]